MGKLPERQEISSDLKWKLEDIYRSNELWEADLAKARASKSQLVQLQGTISSAESLLHALQVRDQVSQLVDRLFVYARMRKDENNADPLYQGYGDLAQSVAVELSSAMAFFEPEVLSLDAKVVRSWVDQEPKLALYRHYLEDILRMKAHTLPKEQEELLAAAGELAQVPSDIFRMFNNADLKFPLVQNDQGEAIELTHGRYIQLLESANQEVRKGAFTAMYETYGLWKNTLATTYLGTVKKEIYFAQARKYDSALEAALDQDNVHPEVYHNLIECIHDHLHLLHRYVAIRKKLLGVAELHMYDLYVPMVGEERMEIPRQTAIEMVQTGLHPLGEQYLQDLSSSFSDGWIDWLENRGKTSGAYSWGTYGVHPYVLMNYENNLDSVFTLAHELGHAMHTFYSNQNQEYVNSEYTIFVAEVASTLNEALLMDDLLKKTQEPKKRAYLLNHYLEQFRGTVFRQAMFAEFEMLVHGLIESGKSLTAEQLGELYYDLNKTYFGDQIVVDHLISLEWARIPHFHRPFYVYKYATGFSAAVSLAQQILKQGEPAVERYLGFLGGGGSDYPLNLLLGAGVDMSKPEPIAQALQVFAELLDELEELMS